MLEKESMIQFQQLKRSFKDSLDGKPLKNLLELGYNDISKPGDVAARLKVGMRTIYNLRERLQRAWRQFVASSRLRN